MLIEKKTLPTGIIQTVGNTPLVQFSRIFDPYPFDFYGKLESFNPGGSVVFGDKPAIRRIPGIGSGRKSNFLDVDRLASVVHVSDHQAARGCRLLMDKESVLAGGSSGAVIHAVSRYASYFSRSVRVVGILPDRGERYLDTVYSDEWVSQLEDELQFEEVG